MAVTVVPITNADVPAAAEYLHNHWGFIPMERWISSMSTDWAEAAPNRGFMLVDDSRIVGVYQAIYSDRKVGGSIERFCNLGGWTVLPEYRAHSVRLLRAILDQPGYHFTDLTAIEPVASLNSRLGFETLDTRSAVIPNLPWPSLPGRIRITSSPETIKESLTGEELGIYLDHEHVLAASHLLIRAGDEVCHVIYRKDPLRRMRPSWLRPQYARILYVSNKSLFGRSARQVSRHLLARQRCLVTVAELRVAGTKIAVPHLTRKFRHSLFKSTGLQPTQVDNLYSELLVV